MSHNSECDGALSSCVSGDITGEMTARGGQLRCPWLLQIHSPLGITTFCSLQLLWGRCNLL
jgi:hypothetical protein